MSTESAPPAEGAGTPGGVELFDKEFVDNYEMLTGNTDQYSLSEKMVHQSGGAILPVHWVACQAVLAFYAGSGVSKVKTSTKANKEASCLELYYNTLESLDEEHFKKSASDFLSFLPEKRRANASSLPVSILRFACGREKPSPSLLPKGLGDHEVRTWFP
jgi:hypothetical protein